MPDRVLGFIGTPDIPWQGVDKTVRFAELCPDIDIDVIGFDLLDGSEEKPSNLILHGYLNKKRSREVLARLMLVGDAGATPQVNGRNICVENQGVFSLWHTDHSSLSRNRAVRS